MSAADDGVGALHLAAEKGHRDCVSVLIEYDANINIGNVSRATPMHWADRRGKKDVIQLLYDHGAKINPRDVVRTPQARAMCVCVCVCVCVCSFVRGNWMTGKKDWKDNLSLVSENSDFSQFSYIFIYLFIFLTFCAYALDSPRQRPKAKGEGGGGEWRRASSRKL